MKNLADISKFSVAEMCNNSSGKTSGSGSMGVYIIVVGMVCFVFGCIDKALLTKTTDVMMF